MNPSGPDRIAHLTEELERVRRELAQLQQAWPQRRRAWSAPRAQAHDGGSLLLLGTWALSAGAPARQDDLSSG